ncbi:MAG: hypothetical protein Fur003_3230 [Candidatus Dojkabacteria bacterium]
MLEWVDQLVASDTKKTIIGNEFSAKEIANGVLTFLEAKSQTPEMQALNYQRAKGIRDGLIRLATAPFRRAEQAAHDGGATTQDGEEPVPQPAERQDAPDTVPNPA